MSKGIDKRIVIFDKFKNNLNFLVENKVIKSDKDYYLCPICLHPHNCIDSISPLTLEDAPPKSLGGSAKTLTCKTCNNTCGYKIDFHLVERLREIDGSKFIPGSVTEVKVKIGNETFQGKISVEKDGTLKMLHSKKNNHPEKLERKMKEIIGGMVLDISFLKSRVIPENLEYALLKTGYLLIFEKFGYSLILDKSYEIVRNQLKYPEKKIYPDGFWLSPPYHKNMTGVYFILDLGLECLLALFCLNTGLTERMFGTLLPLPICPIKTVIENLNEKFEINKGIVLSLYPLEQEDMNYLSDIENIRLMYKWIEERKSTANSKA